MTVKRFLLTMLATTLMCVVCVGILLWNVDPNGARVGGFVLFYAALFFAVWGTMSLLIISVRLVIQRSIAPFTYIGMCLRQALWVALFICLTLFLLSQRLFDWWMSIPLIIGFMSVEGFFLAQDHSKNPRRTRVRPRSAQSFGDTESVRGLGEKVDESEQE